MYTAVRQGRLKNGKYTCKSHLGQGFYVYMLVLNINNDINKSNKNVNLILPNLERHIDHLFILQSPIAIVYFASHKEIKQVKL